ncbi:Uncharacterised protein at_DN0248 [Pycnogonum litorale]
MFRGTSCQSPRLDKSGVATGTSIREDASEDLKRTYRWRGKGCGKRQECFRGPTLCQECKRKIFSRSPNITETNYVLALPTVITEMLATKSGSSKDDSYS